MPSILPARERRDTSIGALHRHAAEIRARMAASAFAQLLTHEDAAATVANAKVVALRAGAT